MTQRKRCDPNASWESQKVASAEKAWASYQAQTGYANPEWEADFKDAWKRDNFHLKDSIPPRTPPKFYRPSPERLAWLKKMEEQKRRMMRPEYQSSLSFTPVSDREMEKGADRMAEPVGWEGDSGQGRSAIMGVVQKVRPKGRFG